MLSLLVWSFWLIAVAYSLWFSFKAKTLQRLTLDDLALTWKVHKQQTKCTASRIHSLITKNDEVVGFQCDCGYKYLQRRLITQKIYTPTQTSIASLTASKDSSALPRIRGSLQNLGIHYSNIIEI